MRLAGGATAEDLFTSLAPALCTTFGVRRVVVSARSGFSRDFGASSDDSGSIRAAYPVLVDGGEGGRIELTIGPANTQGYLTSAMQDVCSLFSIALADHPRAPSQVEREDWRSLFDEHPAPLLVYAVEDARILAVNAAFCESYGYDAIELLGRRFTDVCIPDAEYAELIGLHEDSTNAPVRCRHQKRNGMRLDVEVTTRYCLWLGESACIALINDVTSRTRIERRLVESERRLERVQAIGGVGIFEVDLRSGQRYWSKELYHQLGVALGNALPCSKTFSLDEVHPEDREAVRTAFDAAMKEHATVRVDHRVIHPSGEVVWLQLQADVDFDADGTPIRVIGTTVDITDRKHAEEQLGFLAHYDPLTRLANRQNAMSRLRNLLQYQRKRTRPTLLFVDLDHFKEINDTMGHEAGDQVLIEIGSRLQKALRDSDCVARIGGDEFVVIMSNDTDVDKTHIVAGRIIAAVEKPLRVAGREIILTCSVGIAQAPSEGIDVEGLVSRADMAMYHAKRTGRNRFAIYEDNMLRETLERFQTESELRLAIERREFFLLYQPIMSISQRELTGVEALVRWRHSSGVRTPDQFIRIAEDSDIILAVDDWVLREACRQGTIWLRECPGICMSVNVSRRQLSDPNYARHVLAVLDEVGFDPKSLQLELTETTLTSDLGHARNVLFELRQAGVRIAIDDFGTGYNSLANLRYFSIDALKIDRSFTSGVNSSPSDMAIAGAVVSAGRNLGIRVIAEGVENEDHIDTLRRLGCDDAQGYWFSKPIAADCFEQQFIRVHSTPAPSALTETTPETARA